MVKRETGKLHVTEKIPPLFADYGKGKNPETDDNAFNQIQLNKLVGMCSENGTSIQSCINLHKAILYF
jgi:hypothetical protein